MSVTLINTFEVPEELANQHQKGWEEHTNMLLSDKKSGLISAKFYKALSSSNKYKFVNVAEWKSIEHFSKSINIEEHKKNANPRIKFNPGLFEVVAEMKM